MAKLPFLSARFHGVEGVSKRRNRRRMAWLSLASMLVFTLLFMFVVSESRIELLDSIIETFYVCLSTIVLGYLGLATYDDLNIMKHDTASNKCKKLNNNEKDENSKDSEDGEKDEDENSKIKKGKSNKSE